MDNIIELIGINKSFEDEHILKDLNLYIRNKEFLTLLGPSGCGKTTTLRLIAGFETPDTGKIIFEGKDISHIAPYKRNVNTVFQKYADSGIPCINIILKLPYFRKLPRFKK